MALREMTGESFPLVRYSRLLLVNVTRFGLFILALAITANAQDLEPRAYSISPSDTNILVLGYSRTSGNVIVDPAVPLDLEDVSSSFNGGAAGYLRSISFFGRHANFRATIPYSWGGVSGYLDGGFVSAHRSGLADSRAQLSVILYGAHAMNMKDFMAYRQKTVIGASMSAIMPTGQYDPSRIVNLGFNRWGFKPEIAVSHAMGRWILDGYAGVWFYTDNPNYRSGHVRSQSPLQAYQAHLSYTIRRGMWVALDYTFYRGGRTSMDGIEQNNLQRASRWGVTYSLPIGHRQALKFLYANTILARAGGDFDTVSVGYAFTWFDK